MSEILIPRHQDRIWIDCIKGIEEKFKVNFSVIVFPVGGNRFDINVSQKWDNIKLKEIIELNY